MSWVKEADLPELAEIFRAISSNAQALELVERLNEGIAFGSSALTRAQEEAIATTVSVANRCRYGALTHGGFFRKHADNPDTASQLLADHTQADLSSSDHVMFDFAVKVTLDQASLTEKDLEGLREAGFDDEEIVSIVLVTSLFNFMNRIANSLGAAVPEPLPRSVGIWLNGPAADEVWMLEPDAGQQPGNLTWKGLEKALGDLSKAIPPQAQTVAPEAASDKQEDSLLEKPSAESIPDTVFGVGPVEMPALAAELPEGRAPSDEPTVETTSEEGLVQDHLGDEESPEHSVSDSGAGSERPLADNPTTIDPQLRKFTSECCTVSEQAACTARDLYVAYLKWCNSNQSPPVPQRNFGMALREIGFQRRRRNHGKHWCLGLSVESGEDGQLAAAA